MKYKWLMILYVSTFLIVIIQIFILPPIEAFTNFAIVDTIGGFMMTIFLFIPVGSIIGGLLIGYLLGPLFLFVHKKTIGIKMEYGLQEKRKPAKFKGTWKGFFPAVFAMNVGLILMANPTIQEIVLKPNYRGEDVISQLICFASLLPVTIGIGMGAFSAVWFLLDSGIVYTNKSKVKDTAYPTEVRSVGSWYMYLLKGYAGITVIMTFYTFLSNIILAITSSSTDLTSRILITVIWPFMPIFMAFMALPGVILLDITYEHRKKYIRKFANNLGIKAPLEKPLDLAEEP